MPDYALLKNLHVGCVLLSGGGFLLRGRWMLAGSALLTHPLSRTLPHLVDTVLLGSALWLAALLNQYPFTAPWLTAKFFALLAYIVLGSLALGRGRSRRVRATAFAAALATYAYLIAVAVAHDPWPL
jgi:uncharacterized membrane protein SirB2